MKSAFAIFATASAAIVLVGAFAAASAPKREACVTRSPDKGAHRVAYELIDLLRRQAWVTTDWTLEEYSDFSPGLTSVNWIKNDPRVGTADQTSVLRSPGCANDGEFTYVHMFGRDFFHIADLVRLGHGLGDGAIRGASVTKYHRLQFDPGQVVSILSSPGGERFIRVNGPVGVASTKPEVPLGWTLQDLNTEETWQVDLLGEVRVLRLKDGTSYQGPIATGR